MTLSLVATPGASNANSYVSVDDAELYFAARPFSSAWTSVTDQELKKQALIYATTLLDRERWKGAKGTTYNVALTQALAWPRRWATTLEADAGPEIISEYFIDTAIGYFPPDLIPTPIVRATCELALEILRAGTTDPFPARSLQYVKRDKVDVLETEYFDVNRRVRGLGFFPNVVALIAPLLRASGAAEVERV